MLRDLTDHQHRTLSVCMEKDARPGLGRIVEALGRISPGAIADGPYAEFAHRLGYPIPQEPWEIAEMRARVLGGGFAFGGVVHEFLRALDTLPAGVERETSFNDAIYHFEYRGRRDSQPYLALAELDALGVVSASQTPPRDLLTVLRGPALECARFDLSHALLSGDTTRQQQMVSAYRALACVTATPDDRMALSLEDGVLSVEDLDSLSEPTVRGLLHVFGHEVFAHTGTVLNDRLWERERQQVAGAAEVLERRRRRGRVVHHRQEAELRLRAYATYLLAHEGRTIEQERESRDRWRVRRVTI